MTTRAATVTVELDEVGRRLRAELTRHPGDAQLRLVYADWLEESGQLAEANAQRKRVAYMDASVWPPAESSSAARYYGHKCDVYGNGDGSWTCNFHNGGIITRPSARELHRHLVTTERISWVEQVRLTHFLSSRHLLSHSKPLEEF